MSSGSLVLVTGVSGFLGSHVVTELLKDGYRVRGTVRSKKVAFVQAWYAKYEGKVEIVAFDDLIAGDITDALKGVSAIIHVAAPLVGRSATHEDALNAAIEGSLNVLRQGEKAGVTKFAIVSSIIAVTSFPGLSSGIPLTDKDWNPITREEGLNPSAEGFTVYAAEKTLAEHAVWEFGEKHPHVDITTVNPPFFYGPFAPGWAASEPGVSALSTNGFIYNLLRPDGPSLLHPAVIDVRDVARGLVLSLTAPPTSQVGQKRILMSGPWLSAQEATDYIAEVRPELKDQLSEAAKKSGPIPKHNIDTSRARDVLGLEFRPWKQTLIDAVDSIIAVEKEWKSQGWKP